MGRPGGEMALGNPVQGGRQLQGMVMLLGEFRFDGCGSFYLWWWVAGRPGVGFTSGRP